MPCTITSPTEQSFLETLKNYLEDKENAYARYFEFFLLPELGYHNTERSRTHFDRTELTGLLIAGKVTALISFQL